MIVNIGDYVILRSIEELEEDYEYIDGELHVDEITLLDEMVEEIKNNRNKPLKISNTKPRRVDFEDNGYTYPDVVIKKIVNPKNDPEYFI